MKSSVLLCLAAFAVILGASQTAANDAREHPARRMWAELNLSPEQEAKFKEINSRYAPGRRESSKRLEELRAKINQELMKERPSRSLLAQYAGQMGEHQKKMNIAAVDHLLSVKAVLTPEQFKIFADRASISGSGTSRRRSASSSADGGSAPSADGGSDAADQNDD